MEIEKKKKDSQHQRDECEWRHESGDDGVFPLLHQMKLLFEQKERKKKDWDKYRLKRAKVFFFLDWTSTDNSFDFRWLSKQDNLEKAKKKQEKL